MSPRGDEPFLVDPRVGRVGRPLSVYENGARG